MRTIPACHVPERSPSRNVTVGSHYAAVCPYCTKRALAWPTEWRTRKPVGTNKCPHFDGLTKAGAFRFRKGVAVKVSPHAVTINGVRFPYGLSRLDELFDWLESEGVRDCDSALEPLVPLLERLFAVSSSYAYGDSLNDRFKLIRAEVARIAKAVRG